MMNLNHLLENNVSHLANTNLSLRLLLDNVSGVGTALHMPNLLPLTFKTEGLSCFWRGKLLERALLSFHFDDLSAYDTRQASNDDHAPGPNSAALLLRTLAVVYEDKIPDYALEWILGQCFGSGSAWVQIQFALLAGPGSDFGMRIRFQFYI
jgi:hypothetical protein